MIQFDTATDTHNHSRSTDLTGPSPEGVPEPEASPTPLRNAQPETRPSPISTTTVGKAEQDTQENTGHLGKIINVTTYY